MQFTRLLPGLLLLLVLSACGHNEETPDHWIRPITEKDAAPFPGKPVELSPNLRHRISNADSLRDVLPVSRFVQLQVTPDSVIGTIKDVARIANFWFVHDSLQDLVYQFDDDGTFIRVVGGYGEGPGEYITPEAIEVCMGDRLGIANKGSVQLYDTAGTFLGTYRVQDEHRFYAVNQAFLWPEESRFILLDLYSRNVHAPNHALFQYAEGTFRMSGGFGKRFAPMEEANHRYRVPRWSFDGYAQVGDRIWVGSPYGTTVEAYDLNGRLSGTIERSYPQQVTADQFEERIIKTADDTMDLFLSLRNYKIIPVGDLVLAFLVTKDGFWTDIYDREGNLLKKELRTIAPYVQPILGTQNNLVAVQGIFQSVSAFGEVLTPEEIDLLRASGLKDDDFHGDNPYLVIGAPLE